MEVINYHSPATGSVSEPGRKLASLSVICALTGAALGATGAAFGYHSSFLDPAQFAFVLLMFLSCIVGLVGVMYGVVAVARSRGRRGWIGLALSIIVTVMVIIGWFKVPMYGLGNIKG
jgi:uncharacterized membrane protein HdeD (DUF308 family)